VSASLYFLALIGALSLCVVGGLMAHRPKRRCLRCQKRIPMSVRRCRYCGYEME
jgi:predicted amidophosphoribosyltransferase